MKDFSRRGFLKLLGVAFAAAATRNFAFGEELSPFEFLVVGDSLVWGQGLEEKDKFYTLTGNWLQQEVFAEKRKVNLKVKAHSGATIFLHQKEFEALKKNGGADHLNFPPEVNLVFPTLDSQINLAKKEYVAEGKNPNAVNLVMLTGGLVDISVARLLSPFGNDKTFREEIRQFCNDDMFRFLETSASTFPNALFVVVGYFPIMSRYTQKHPLFNALLEAYSIPRFLKPILNNPITSPIWNILRKGGIRRSKIWAEYSDLELQNAVKRLNEKFSATRAVFVKTPVTEETCFNTKKTILFSVGKKGRSDDFLYDERIAKCGKTIEVVTKKFDLDQSTRFCELAAIGHPNIEGSRAYHESIKATLSPMFRF
jgi:hypothetical protein